MLFALDIYRSSHPLKDDQYLPNKVLRFLHLLVIGGLLLSSASYPLHTKQLCNELHIQPENQVLQVQGQQGSLAIAYYACTLSVDILIVPSAQLGDAQETLPALSQKQLSTR
mmetsp:Transcript_9428/g.18140  ORF Transcript_9428/g.18140 Transcript_9428/m.18140 type:complete len:112 (-) Transcript_9428:369-704(-)